MLRTADIRSNFVERIWISSRGWISGAILRTIDPRADITASEERFRSFVKIIKSYGGVIVFEALSETDEDDFVAERCDRVKEFSETA